MAQFETLTSSHTTIEDMVGTKDKVVVRPSDRFTRQADGKPMELTRIEIIRLENGKITEAWVEADMRPDRLRW